MTGAERHVTVVHMTSVRAQQHEIMIKNTKKPFHSSALCVLALACLFCHACKMKVKPTPEQAAFEQADRQVWSPVLTDSCIGDWTGQWFLDGLVGSVTNSARGMELHAGPVYKNDAHHMVLWTKKTFEGDLRIDYDFTRLDTSTNGVCILYIEATGSGEKPYLKDITAWNELRRVPSMDMYFAHMNAYHISYATPIIKESNFISYIRGRRYMPTEKTLKGTALEPDYEVTGLFGTGVPHRIIVIKTDRDLYMKVSNGVQTNYFHMVNEALPIVTEGRIGLRQMYTRASVYKNFNISAPVQLKPKEKTE